MTPEDVKKWALTHDMPAGAQRTMADAVHAMVERIVSLNDLLSRVIDNVGLRACAKCGHFHMPGHVCYECGHDGSVRGHCLRCGDEMRGGGDFCTKVCRVRYEGTSNKASS